MIEKQIKDDYKLGKLKGITELPEYFYIPVRITGTGLSLRSCDGEKIVSDRQKVDFFSQQFLDHAKTLPILCNHPKTEGGMLTPGNLKDNPIIGNCIDSWIQDDEVWGLARIYDKSLLNKLGEDIQSTSPAVYVNYENTSEYGIVKEAPGLINHLAFVDSGHWDSFDSKGFDNSEKNVAIDENNGIITNDTNLEKGKNMPENIVDSRFDKAVDSETKAVDKETKVVDEETKVVDEETKVVDEETKAVDEETKAVDGSEIEEIADDDSEIEEIADDDSEIEEIVDDDSEIEEIAADSDDTEVIDSEIETSEDKARDKAVDAMRATCDSAHSSLGVVMPVFKSRQTLRSAVNKFVIANRSFVDSKYSNLAVDSYTSELALEVLNSTLSNIKKESDSLKPKGSGMVDTGRGYSTQSDFGWR